jgi:hypothetical protein
MYCINDCIDRFQTTLNKIKNSGLYDITNNIHLCLNGDDAPIIKERLQLNDDKIIINVFTENTHGEFNTLNYIWDFCQNNDGKILYLHSKGITRNDNQCVLDWSEYMEYYTIEKHKECLNRLDHYDTVGSNLQKEPMWHYSGNIWWVNANYVKKLKKLKDHERFDDRLYCEFWLLDNDFHRAGMIFNTSKNHYYDLFDRSKYAFDIKRTSWEGKKKIDVSSAWIGLEEYIPSIISSLNINPKHCLEFGVDHGYSTHIFSQLFEKVTGVDSFAGDDHIHHQQGNDFYNTVLERFKGTNVDIIKSSFQDFTNNNNNQYDLIHIDIVHHYNETYECTDWAINHSKVVILHDTVSFTEMYRVCDEISRKYQISFYNIIDNNGLGILIKN